MVHCGVSEFSWRPGGCPMVFMQALVYSAASIFKTAGESAQAIYAARRRRRNRPETLRQMNCGPVPLTCLSRSDTTIPSPAFFSGRRLHGGRATPGAVAEGGTTCVSRWGGEGRLRNKSALESGPTQVYGPPKGKTALLICHAVFVGSPSGEQLRAVRLKAHLQKMCAVA